MRVVSLVGLPGSGKSTVGKALRDNHGWFYVDSDEEIERETSRTTANIIREDGEKAFREIESRVIGRLVCNLVNKSELDEESSSWAVLSLGGGAITVEAVLSLLLAKTVLISLEVSHQEQVSRIVNCQNRPLISGASADEVEVKLRKLRAKREALYGRAKHKIVTDQKTANQVALEIIEVVKSRS